MTPNTSAKRIAVVGLGYAGLVIAACLAKMGYRVVGIEVNEGYLADLRSNRLPFYEPGLREVVAQLRASGMLSLVDDPAVGVKGAYFVFLMVGTPEGTHGEVDLSQIEAAVSGLAPNIEPETVIVIKSTVPIHTAARVRDIVKAARGPGFRFGVVSNPEFLRQGRALESFMQPDRIVIGGDDPEYVARVAELYRDVPSPVLKTDHKTAAMIKYASNAFIATKISFANEFANLCGALGVDWLTVADAIGADPRIGRKFLNAGVGFGGSCFPKDLKAIAAAARATGRPLTLAEAALEVNKRQPQEVTRMLEQELGDLSGKRIAILGLSFKPGTDDVRESRALLIAAEAAEGGAEVVGYDPLVRDEFALRLSVQDRANFRRAATIDEALKGADAVVVQHESAEFGALDPAKLKRLMRRAVVVDGRRALDGAKFRKAGVAYRGIGAGRDG